MFLRNYQGILGIPFVCFLDRASILVIQLRCLFLVSAKTEKQDA